MPTQPEIHTTFAVDDDGRTRVSIELSSLYDFTVSALLVGVDKASELGRSSGPTRSGQA